MRSDSKNIVEILKNDFKSTFSNPFVVIALIVLIILPSLYAILNIQACWDPYEKTNDVEFAIANMDKGATFDGQPINIGNEVAKELEKNDDFNWVFMSEEELRKGVHDGDYYAGIVLPSDLSENVMSISSEDPKTAELNYVVNVESNPVAAKLTKTASNTVYRTINAKIVQFIDVAAYNKLGELQDGLASGSTQLSSGGSQLASGASQVASGAGTVSSGAAKLTDSASKVKNGASDVSSGASKVSSGSKSVNDGASKVSSSANSIRSGSDQIQQGAKDLESKANPSLLPEPVREVVAGSVYLANSSSQLAQKSGDLAQGSASLAGSSSKLANGASDVANGANSVANGASGIADGSSELAKGALALAAGSELLSSNAAQALFSAASALSTASGSLSNITGINESQIGDYIYSPVKLNTEEIFPASNFGSQVAPFYIALSMWVGAIITCVIVKPGTSIGTKYTPVEIYFGKLGLFIILSLLQGCVTAGGLMMLGIDIVNPPLFIFSALLVSVTFMTLIYSLISALGLVGEAIAIIFLVLQISGTGGIYPIEIMDPFFKILYPYLPMTYGINLIRGSLLGVVWPNYLTALGVIVGILIVTLILGTLAKIKADRATKYIDNRLKDSGLF